MMEVLAAHYASESDSEDEDAEQKESDRSDVISRATNKTFNAAANIDESFKAVTDNAVTVDNEQVPALASESACDFFSLAPADVADDAASCLVESTVETPATIRQKARNQAATVDFWSSSIPTVDWSCTEKIWGTNPETAESDSSIVVASTVQKSEGLSKRSNDSTLKTYNSKRLRSNINDGGCDGNRLATPLSKSCFIVHQKIAPHLHCARSQPVACRIPRKILTVLPGHSGAVNRINWCRAEYGHLLASAAMDGTVRIWNVFSSLPDPCVRSLNGHTKAVRDAVWSSCGRQVLSCGFDGTARISDVEKGTEVCICIHPGHVFCSRFSPVDPNLFVSGLTDVLIGWDRRCPAKPIRRYKYKDKFQQVQDICFFENGSQFLACNDVVGRDSPDRNIMVWDFVTGAVLSNQIYQERYTCTRLRIHPTEAQFFAQSQGDYIAEFSTIPPYRMNKCKRFEGHKVAGYGVGFDVSCDGKFIASGSADGHVLLYDSRTTNTLSRLASADQNDVVLDVVWHPVLFSTIAASTWSGHVIVWQ